MFANEAGRARVGIARADRTPVLATLSMSIQRKMYTAVAQRTRKRKESNVSATIIDGSGKTSLDANMARRGEEPGSRLLAFEP